MRWVQNAPFGLYTNPLSWYPVGQHRDLGAIRLAEFPSLASTIFRVWCESSRTEGNLDAVSAAALPTNHRSFIFRRAWHSSLLGSNLTSLQSLD